MSKVYFLRLIKWFPKTVFEVFLFCIFFGLNCPSNFFIISGFFLAIVDTDTFQSLENFLFYPHPTCYGMVVGFLQRVRNFLDLFQNSIFQNKN